MRYTMLGSTDLKVSRLCLGTMTFGKQTDEAEAHRVLDRAAVGGINFIDTADGYPMGMPDLSRTGRTEEIIGRWLKGKRDSLVIATKAGAQMSDDPADQGGSRAHLMDAIDGSLRRLRIDYVDLYQMHFDDVATPLEETLRALDDIVRSGKARHIGISNIEPKRLAEALQLSDRLQLARYVSVQPRYNLLYRDAERELLPLARAENLAVIPYNPLAGGMLTGRYRRGSKPSTGRFSQEIGQFGTMYRQRYWHESAFTIVEGAQRAAYESGVPLAKLVIAWCLANPAITSAIIGASRAAQLDDTLDASDFGLAPDLKDKLDKLAPTNQERGFLTGKTAQVDGGSMDLPDAPIAQEGFFVTHFLTVADQAKSRDFYVGILGGRVIREENPCYIKLANSWVVLNSGGGPTPDKPDVLLETPRNLNKVSSFLNLRVADIRACYSEWKAKGAEFLTEPLDNHGSEMRCYMRDPDGYLIEVGQYSQRAIDHFNDYLARTKRPAA